jgi:hypothetical protein
MRTALLFVAACTGSDKTGTTPTTPTPVDADGDGFTEDIDCDDTRETVHPEAPEICSGLDDDCDGLIDEFDDSLTGGTVLYEDSDGDGYGDRDRASVVCGYGVGVTTGDDCDDSSASVAPGAPELCGDEIDQDCSGADEPCPDNLLPVAPADGDFMWQGVQTAFTNNGEPCTGSLALAMGDQVFCYVDTSGQQELFCAGRTFTETWGPSFVSTGLLGVQQVLQIPTFNQENGNGTCALVQGLPTCLAHWNASGQLGTGGTASSETWTPWIAGEGLAWLASGTSDSFCGPTAAGDVWCTGDSFGSTPQIAGQTSEQKVWINTFGQLQLDDPSVRRTSQGRSECTIGSQGLRCSISEAELWGRAGHVVDGGMISPPPPDFDGEAVVWLEDDGSVWRGAVDDYGYIAVDEHFTDMPVLAIAYHYYTDTFCGVYNDGSLVCFGTNDQGKLGTGALAPLQQDTVVLPAGSFEPRCQ